MGQKIPKKTITDSGGTYTLSGVKNNKGKQVSSKLDKISKNKSSLYSNEFWPMDYASSYGTDGHDLKFGNLNSKDLRNFVGIDGSELKYLEPFQQVMIKIMIIILTFV